MGLITDIDSVEVIAPNFKRRLSGVTSTIVQLVPAQRALGCGVVALGPGLPGDMPHIRFRDVWQLWKRPKSSNYRVWHARRNVEMIAGLVLRDILRMPLKVIFTSAAQRHHKSFTKWLIRRMDHVVATSARSGTFLDVPHDIIMHGVDTETFHPPLTEADRFEKSDLPGTYAIGCAGRVRHQKGTDIFVDAMITLLPRYPDWTAVITGRTTAEHQAFESELKQKISATGLTDRIQFLGEVPDMKLWYRRFSLFVAPSRNEGFGLTPLEAMASGTAVVTSDAGAYAEMVTSGAGIVTPAGHVAALAAAIEMFLRDPHNTEKAGRAAREHVVKEFPLEGEASKLNAIYRKLIEQPAT
jgi:mannosyltransferase